MKSFIFLMVTSFAGGPLGCSEEDECDTKYLAYCEDESHISVCDIESPGNDSTRLSWYSSKCPTGTPYCISTQGTAVCSSSTSPDPNCPEELSYSSYCSDEETIQGCEYDYPTIIILCISLRSCVNELTDRATCKPAP